MKKKIPKELRIKEPMTKKEKKEFGKDNPHRIEYVYGALFHGDVKKPILLRSSDFWMPLSRAKKIHKWLGKAIAFCEKRAAHGRH